MGTFPCSMAVPFAPNWQTSFTNRHLPRLLSYPNLIITYLIVLYFIKLHFAAKSFCDFCQNIRDDSLKVSLLLELSHWTEGEHLLFQSNNTCRFWSVSKHPPCQTQRVSMCYTFKRFKIFYRAQRYVECKTKLCTVPLLTFKKTLGVLWIIQSSDGTTNDLVNEL